MKYAVIAGMVFLALGSGAGEVRAQIPIGGPGNPQPYRPAFSPYLNLLRGGTSTAVNYYGIVRPQLNFGNSINNLQQQTANEQQEITGLQFGNLPTTGHPVQFLNLKGYFQTMQGGAGVTGGTGSQVRSGGLQGPSPLSQNALGGAPTTPRH